MHAPSRRPTIVARSGERQRISPRAWNHQDVLRELRGKQIRMEFAGGDDEFGTLLEADQFTLYIRVGQSALIYFKSELRSIQEVQA